MTAPKYSKSLTKLTLAKQVALKHGIEDMQILEIIEDALDFISLAIASGERVEFRDFGNFQLFKTAERMGRNPKKPKEEFLIPSMHRVKFKAGKRMQARVDKMKGKA